MCWDAQWVDYEGRWGVWGLNGAFVMVLFLLLRSDTFFVSRYMVKLRYQLAHG